MKKMLIALIMISGLVLTSNAFASIPDTFMTDSSGSFVPRTEFSLSETPWLYLHLPDAGLNVVASWWQSPSLTYTFAGTSPSTAQDIWISPSDWATIKTTGIWNVNAGYSYATGETGARSASFTVTPEPISSALFLLGGGALALRTYRKRAAKKA